MIKKTDLIECIRIGYREATQDRLNDENPEYEPTYQDLPIAGDESQYAWEKGTMMGREQFELVDEEMDEYLTDILFDSDSSLTLSDLV